MIFARRVKVIISGIHAHRNISETTRRSLLDYDITAVPAIIFNPKTSRS